MLVAVAREGFSYGGDKFDRGQVFELKGFKNDEGLLRNKHVVPVPDSDELFECGECGAKFTHASLLDVHGHNTHGNR
jgi:hypothetical protein